MCRLVMPFKQSLSKGLIGGFNCLEICICSFVQQRRLRLTKFVRMKLLPEESLHLVTGYVNPFILAYSTEGHICAVGEPPYRSQAFNKVECIGFVKGLPQRGVLPISRIDGYKGRIPVSAGSFYSGTYISFQRTIKPPA